MSVELTYTPWPQLHPMLTSIPLNYYVLPLLYVVTSFQHILKLLEFVFTNTTSNIPGEYQNIFDGLRYMNLVSSHSSEPLLPLWFYLDDVCMRNPITSNSKLRSVSVGLLTIADLPSHLSTSLRSKFVLFVSMANDLVAHNTSLLDYLKESIELV